MKLSLCSSRSVATALLLLSVTCAACGGSETSPISPSAPGASTPGGEGGTSGPTSTPDKLLGQWTLVSVVRNGVSETVPKGTGSFSLTFQSDGRLGMRADCNSCGGAYQADATGLVVGNNAACTRAYCSTAPFDDQFVASVMGSTRWEVTGDRLVLSSASAVLTFQRG